MKKNWIGMGLAALAFAASVSAGFACEQHAQAADPKDAKEAKDSKVVAAKNTTAVAAKDTLVAAADDHAKGCDMPCCAHAKAAAGDKNAGNDAAGKPCTAQDAKGCPKKTGTTSAAAKSEPAKDTAQAQPAADPGTHR